MRPIKLELNSRFFIMLKQILLNSENLIISALGMDKFQKERNSLPKINEVFQFFHSLLEGKESINEGDIDSLPADLKALKTNLYKDNNYLISCTKVTAQEFKYLAMYSASLLTQSVISDELSGVYMCILRKCEDGIHYEPTAFSYLFRDEFFYSVSDRFIVPLLILPTTIPEQLEFQWPYLAMRELSLNHSPTLDYKYLLQDEKEIELAKLFNVF